LNAANSFLTTEEMVVEEEMVEVKDVVEALV
jgi:hypothetical protein